MDKKIFEFSMDNISDDIYVSGQFDDTYTEDLVVSVLNSIRGQKWFTEGMKTRGEITFFTSMDCIVDWEVLKMTDNFNTEIESYHSERVMFNYGGSYKVVEV